MITHCDDHQVPPERGWLSEGMGGSVLPIVDKAPTLPHYCAQEGSK